ncbi:MAG: glycosyltransferase [Bacteroidetes bacterium]|nr:glycosyltransferase [Bacteroidota bacterium]
MELFPADIDLISIILLATFLTAWVVQLFYYLFFFLRLAIYKEKSQTSNKPPVSVIICARNEYHNLRRNLDDVLKQDYPCYEVVVVNDNSDDDSHFLLDEYTKKYPHLKVVEIRQNLNFFTGKKFPLSIGIKEATHDFLLLTDADCRPASSQWISHMMECYGGGKEIILGYGAYEKKKGLLNVLIRFDAFQIAIQYLSYCLAGLTYMGVGRNLSYQKELFYRSGGFISHYTIRSGDDDLFINRIAKKGNTAICVHPEAHTVSRAKTSLKSWIRQKRRHLSTSGHYRVIHRFLLSLYALSMLVFWGMIVVMLSLGVTPWIALIAFVIRSGLHLLLFSKSSKHLGERSLVFFSPLLELLLLIINTFTALTNPFLKKDQWK